MTLDFSHANGAHTGMDIAIIFQKFLKEYNLQYKIQGITLDNAASNTKFIAEFKLLMDEDGIEFDVKNQHFKCIAHVKNLGVQDFLKELQLKNEIELDSDYENADDEETEDLNEMDETILNYSPIQKLRKLFIKLKYSEQLRKKLECFCITSDVQMISPNNDVKTRWYSTDDMISKALKMRKPINLLCDSD